MRSYRLTGLKGARERNIWMNHVPTKRNTGRSRVVPFCSIAPSTAHFASGLRACINKRPYIIYKSLMHRRQGRITSNVRGKQRYTGLLWSFEWPIAGESLRSISVRVTCSNRLAKSIRSAEFVVSKREFLILRFVFDERRYRVEFNLSYCSVWCKFWSLVLVGYREIDPSRDKIETGVGLIERFKWGTYSQVDIVISFEFLLLRIFINFTYIYDRSF